MSSSPVPTLPSDPLSVLGASLSLQILSYLPLQDLLTTRLLSRSHYALIENHSVSLFRHQARELGIEIPRYKALIEEERATASSIWSDSASGDGTPQGERSVNWEEVCKSHVGLRGNWRHGRATESWITPGRNTVWRFKVDEEEGTIITTSRMDGILVSDLESSEPIFEYEDVHQYSHLEFAKGFVVFNVGHRDEDHGLEVHLTPSALRRLPQPLRAKLANPRRSQCHDTAYSFTQNGHYNPPLQSLRSDDPPRGHLTYYRTITPPTSCFAFRARIDREHTEEERAVLGAAGEEGVYIFDLEDASRMEKYVIPQDERQLPNYIEFDDDYIFICAKHQVHIYSRRTRSKLLSFPEKTSDQNLGGNYEAPDVDQFRYVRSRLQEREARAARARAKGRADGSEGRVDEAWFGRAEVDGEWLADAPKCGYSVNLDGTSSARFTACHYTSSDLFALTTLGMLFILKDYKSVLSLPASTETQRRIRYKRIRDNTILLVLPGGGDVKHLTAYGEHVVVATKSAIWVMDAATLPAAPYGPLATDAELGRPSRPHSGPWRWDNLEELQLLQEEERERQRIRDDPNADHRPRISILTIFSLNREATEQISCLQADREHLYCVYWARGEMDSGGTKFPILEEHDLKDPDADEDTTHMHDDAEWVERRQKARKRYARPARVGEEDEVEGLPEALSMGRYPPGEAVRDFGLCIKRWDFGVD